MTAWIKLTNRYRTKYVPGVLTKYKSFDSAVDTDNVVNYPLEFLNTLEPLGNDFSYLQFGDRISSNGSEESGHPKTMQCNTALYQTYFAKYHRSHGINGKGKRKDVFIPRIPLIPTDPTFNFKRAQFPVRLTFATTINKAEGQSHKFADVNLLVFAFLMGNCM